MSENVYVQYYTQQIGGGATDFGSLYYNPRFIQQGRGFANFFAAVYKYLKPLITSGLGALKNTAIKTGTSVLTELGSRPFREILIEHGNNAKNELEKKFMNKFQEGQGLFSFSNLKESIKRVKNKVKRKVTPKPHRKKVEKKLKKSVKVKKTLKKRVLDIFTKNK